MKIVRNDALAKAILDDQFGVSFSAPFSGFVIKDQGFPVGAYILNCFTGHDVEMTIASKCVLPIGLARQIARDCFVGLGVSRVTFKTRVSNTLARAALAAIGCEQESIARDYFGTEDAAVYALLKRNQKLVRL